MKVRISVNCRFKVDECNWNYGNLIEHGYLLCILFEEYQLIQD